MPLSRPAELADKGAHRLSVSLSDDQYARVAELARRNRVSIAWVVREAVERMLDDKQPQLRQGKRRP
jgi:predicted transcriptional regulator